MAAVIAISVVLSGCENLYNDPKEPVNKIDEEIGDEENSLTPRKLFGVSEETVKCAGIIKASGEYRFGDLHDTEFSYSDESCKGMIEYTRARDVSGNTSSCLSGNVDFEIVSYDDGIPIRGIDRDYKENKKARYEYYKQNIEGKSEDRFVYYGTSGICDSIDIDKILMPDISQLFVAEILVNDGKISVVITDGMQSIIDGFGDGIMGTALISQAIYDFDANTHQLRGVSIHGDTHRDNSQEIDTFNNSKPYVYSDTESASFNLTLNIDGIEKAPSEMIQMPEICTQNGNLNDLILKDKEFTYCQIINSPFDIESESHDDIQKIWSDFITGIEKDSCNIKEMNTALKEIAPKYGCDEVESSYAFIGSEYHSGGLNLRGIFRYHKDQQDYGYDEVVLVKNEFLSAGTVKYAIIVPIFIDEDKAQAKTGIAIDGADYVKLGYNGIVEYAHEYSPDCRRHAIYKFDDAGTINKKYEETKVDKIYALGNESNLAFYPEADRDALKSMADSLDIAAIAGITKINIFESDNEYSSEDGNAEKNQFYVIEYDLGETRINEIKEEYSLDIIPQKERDSILTKKKIGNVEQEVTWNQFSEEE